ncbi:hypothetical protein L798_14158 [Zootermopsis nevadensis]|uniref:CCHC-type domain-containing protein n=1 Tax=Zootermopsis nevadensis TaxID=136037 RepID=A0A067RIQ6_ZOONE|nr:hypothetical protein L798_14158 [Zootermopsis nevadensis]
MGTELRREARTRLERLNPNFVEGGISLIGEFLKGNFVAGLKDDKVKYIVKARSEDDSLAQLIETALQEESEVRSQKYRQPGNYGWPNYSGTIKKENTPHIKREVNVASNTVCYKCQGHGHIAKHCNNKPLCTKCKRQGH